MAGRYDALNATGSPSPPPNATPPLSTLNVEHSLADCPSDGEILMAAGGLALGGPIGAGAQAGTIMLKSAGVKQVAGHDIPATGIETVIGGLACHGTKTPNNPSTLPKMSPGGG